jgi:hypothetical protein
MKKNAAFRDSFNPRLRLAPVVLSAAAALLLTAPAGTASAAPAVGKDGQIHACYRVKGKPKGALRVTRSARARCRRGERKVAWSVSGSSGLPTSSTQGAEGQSGASGAAGSNEAALKAQVGALSLRVETLEGLLAGATNDLLGMSAVLQGLTNEDLLDAVNSVSAVEALCEQSPLLAEQANLLQDVIGGLGLAPALELIGLLEIPVLPEELDIEDFGCPAP